MTVESGIAKVGNLENKEKTIYLPKVLFVLNANSKQRNLILVISRLINHKELVIPAVASDCV